MAAATPGSKPGGRRRATTRGTFPGAEALDADPAVPLRLDRQRRPGLFALGIALFALGGVGGIMLLASWNSLVADGWDSSRSGPLSMMLGGCIIGVLGGILLAVIGRGGSGWVVHTDTGRRLERIHTVHRPALVRDMPRIREKLASGDPRLLGHPAEGQSAQVRALRADHGPSGAWIEVWDDPPALTAYIGLAQWPGDFFAPATPFPSIVVTGDAYDDLQLMRDRGFRVGALTRNDRRHLDAHYGPHTGGRL